MFKKILQGYCGLVGFVVMLAGKAAALLMPLLAAVVAYEVFSRYFLGAPTIWAFDLSLFMFGYIAALGGAWAQLKRAHINVDILYLSVSRQTRAVFNLVSYTLAIFFLLVVADMGLVKLEEALEYDYRRQSEWAPPMFHFWVMLVLACGLFIAQMSRDMLAEGYLLISGDHLLEQE